MAIVTMQNKDIVFHMEFGHIVLINRKSVFHISQSELAGKVGVSRNEISAIENLTANPKLTTVMKILDVLNLKLVIEPKED